MILLTTKEIEFIPSKEKDSKEPITFFLKPPTFETSLKIQQILAKSVNEQGEFDASQLDNVNLIKTVLLDCVVGWKNVFCLNEQGEKIPLSFTKDNFLYLNDLEIIYELYQKLNEISVPPKKTEDS